MSIKSNRYVTLQDYYDHILIKILGNLNPRMDTKTQIRRLINPYRKHDLKLQILLIPKFLFLLFSAIFKKQNTLEDNK